MKLSPITIDALANCICGGDGTSVAYRTATSIARFRAFAGVVVEWEPGSSRFNDAVAYLEAANDLPAGGSGLPRGIEKIVLALADRRQFESQDAQDDVLAELESILEPYEVELTIDVRRNVQLTSRATSPGQIVVDKEIHTVFEQQLRDSDLEAARAHYRKARRFLRAAEPDFENAAKEAVCSVESLLLALTGAADFNKAIAKSTTEGLVPKPLGELIRKLYAYRGDEPGVAHAGNSVPDVDAEDAQFVVNLAATVGLYLRAKLSEPEH